MSGENISPNMLLPVPGVGVTTGPEYATDINNCLTVIDSHNHSNGSGVQITPTGLLISSDLSFISNNAIALRSVRFSIQPSVLALGTDLACLYATGVDLYYNDGNGTNIRLTQSGGIAGSPGSISNLTSPASAAYVSGSQTFVWQSNANTPANMDNASVILRNLSANSFGLTLSPPAAMPADYTIVLPSLPVATSVVTIDSSGNMSTVPIIPAGTISMYGGASAPTGYLICDGSSQARASFPALFSAIGTAYGSASGSTFNLPDLRGSFPRGVDGSRGLDPNAATRTAQATGGNTGNNVGSVQGDETKVNSLAIVDPGHTHIERAALSGGGGVVINKQNGAGAGSPDSINTTTDGAVTGISLSGGSETRPVNVYVNFIIKT